MSDFHTLHILNKPPEHPRFAECLGMSSPDDALLLIENGVLALASPERLSDRKVYALSPDVRARGLTASEGLLDYTDMVSLTLKAERVISW